MFADPIANVTYNSVAQTLPRISTNGLKSVYRTADGSLVITISHTNSSKRVRSMFRIDRNIDVNSDNVLETYAAYTVIDRPVSGFSSTDVVNLVTCLVGVLSASSYAATLKLYGGES